MHEGHRLRMYEKLRKHPDVLEEHELLEILLFNAVPRANTNPLAHRLLDEFGSIERILFADTDALLQIDGIGPQLAGYLKCVSFVVEKYSEAKQTVIPKKYDTENFSAHLRDFFSKQSYEVFTVYVLDEKNNVLCRKKFTDKEENSVTVPPQELTKLASQYAGKSFILAHNHVHGSARPSASDDELTVQFQVLCSINNIRLLDHFIYADGDLYSYYQSGRMANIARNYHIQSVLSKGEKGSL